MEGARRQLRPGLRRAARTLFAIALALVFVGSVVQVSIGPEFRLSDKLQHALAFFLLALLARVGYPEARVADRLMLGLLAYGLFIELVQGLLPWRECSLFDWAADAAGVALGSLPWLRPRRAGSRGG
jgi:peptidoglycan/LPS O-acetylase OafA/YrhL